jgi:hypothetical protein
MSNNGATKRAQIPDETSPRAVPPRPNLGKIGIYLAATIALLGLLKQVLDPMPSIIHSMIEVSSELSKILPGSSKDCSPDLSLEEYLKCNP